MDGFDVHAYGWILSRCSLWEAIRLQLGFPPRVDRTKLDRIAELWGDIGVAMTNDCSGEQNAGNPSEKKIQGGPFRDVRQILDPRRILLGEKSRSAMKVLVEYLAEVWPDCFGHAALARRFWNRIISATVSLSFLFFILPEAEIAQPFRGYVTVFLLIFGTLSLGLAFQYHRAARLFNRLGIR